MNLLSHSPYFTIDFDKFVPAFHHHFGHQCKVSAYGFSKLIDLLEAIPDIVKVSIMPSYLYKISLRDMCALNKNV